MKFVKGMSVGIIAGAALALAVCPIDRKRVMRTPAGKAWRKCADMLDDVRDAF